MRSTAALLVVLLVLSPVAGSAVVRSGGGGPSGQPALSPVSEAKQEVDNRTVAAGTTMLVSLQEDGDARWTVSARFALRNDNETAAFRKLAKEYETGDSDAGFTRATFERAVTHAAPDADRQMEIRNVTRSARLLENGTIGVLTLSFTWTNFARTQEDRLIVGDVFTSDSGTWLPSLSDDQTLIIDGPDGYIVRTSPHPVTRFNRLRYEGPKSFEPGEITVTYAPRSDPTTTPGDGTTDTTTPTKGWTDFSGLSGLALVLLVFGIGGVGAYALVQRRGADPDPAPEAVDPNPESADRTASAAQSAEADADDGEEDDEPDAELLSDEERVLRLLRENDGRMKQADIVKETNWSNAKVSQLLKKMDQNDDVNKLRIGRENLITLPDEDVTDVD